MVHDVVILGGGPAGSAAALSLHRLSPNARVLLVEASHYSEWRVGETLPPGSQAILQGLGCWERFCAQQFLEACGTSAAWGGPQPHDNEFIFSTRGTGWHLDRVRFDAMLCDCAREGGVEVRQDARFAGARRDAGAPWQITLHQEGRCEEIAARFVVDATGRQACFARTQGARRESEDRLTGVFLRFRYPPDRPPVDVSTLVEAQAEGWWYSAVTPDSLAVVAWMSDADLIRQRRLQSTPVWLEHLARAPLTAARVARAHPEPTVSVFSARSQRLKRLTGPAWLATGDAASTFDPLSSQGILKALRSGKIAGFVAHDFLEGRTEALGRYERMVIAEYESYQTGKSWFYQQEQRWPDSPFWARRRPAATTVAGSQPTPVVASGWSTGSPH